MYLFKNNATSRLKIITPAGSTTLTVLDGEGDRFPSPVAPDFFLVTLDDRRTGQIEICKCTARTNNILTVERGQEGTVAQDFAEWATVSNRVTAGTFDYLVDTVINAAGYDKIEADGRFLNTAGDTATGAIKGISPVDADDLTRKDYVDAQDATKASLVHTHPISDVVNLQAELDTKIEAGPLDGADYVQHLGVWSPINWTTLDGKPTTFPAQPHTHSMLEVEGLNSTLQGMDAEIDTKVGPDAASDNVIYGRKNGGWVDVSQGLTWGQIPGTPTTFPPSSHMHPIAEVLDLQTTLDGKEPVIAAGNPAYFWAGDKTWKAFQQTVAAASISDTPPTSPVPGQMWWESDTGYMFIRYQDVNSQQWVQVNNPGLSDAPADGQQYARRDGDWTVVTGGGGGSGSGTVDYGEQGQVAIYWGSNYTVSGINELFYNNSDSRFTVKVNPYTSNGGLEIYNKGDISSAVLNVEAGVLTVNGVPVGSGGGGGLDQATADVRYVNVTGDTMTGILTLNGTCTSNLHAVHKAYVDANFAGVSYVNSQDALNVAKAGSTMTGKLILPASAAGAAPINIPHGSDPSTPVNGDLWTTTTSIRGRFNGTVRVVALTSIDNSFSFLQTFKASTTGSGSISLPHGTAPTSPVNGEMWSTTAGLFMRINGATVGPFGAGGGGLDQATADTLYVNVGGDTMSGPLQVPLGDQSAPSVQFASPLAGFYSLGVANITAVANNVLAFDFGSTFNYSRLPLRVPSGSATATALHFGTAGTGLFGSGSAVQLSVSGAMRFASTAAENISTVPISLPADPTTALQAATKQYVDNKPGGDPNAVIGPASATDNVVPRFDTATGKLIQTSTFTLEDDGKFTINSGANKIVEYGIPAQGSAGGFSIRAMPPHGQQITFIPRSDLDGASHCTVGLTFDGPVTLPNASPAGDNVAARKKYVDDGLALKLSLTGGALTGFLTLHADPDAPMKAATKQYVDAKSSSAGVTDGSNAAAGVIGEVWSWQGELAWTSYYAMLTSGAIPAGDWDIYINVAGGAAATTAYMQWQINNSGAFPNSVINTGTANGSALQSFIVPIYGSYTRGSVPPFRLSVAAPTAITGSVTAYNSSQGTVNQTGTVGIIIWARRRR